MFNPLNAELNPIRHLLALVGARHIDHVSRIRVKMEERETGRSVVCLEMFSVSWRHVYKLPGWALRLLVEVSSGDLRGNSRMHTGFVLWRGDACLLTQREMARLCMERRLRFANVLCLPP